MRFRVSVVGVGPAIVDDTVAVWARIAGLVFAAAAAASEVALAAKCLGRIGVKSAVGELLCLRNLTRFLFLSISLVWNEEGEGGGGFR